QQPAIFDALTSDFHFRTSPPLSASPGPAQDRPSPAPAPNPTPAIPQPVPPPPTSLPDAPKPVPKDSLPPTAKPAPPSAPPSRGSDPTPGRASTGRDPLPPFPWPPPAPSEQVILDRALFKTGQPLSAIGDQLTRALARSKYEYSLYHAP